jgi:hypothetical protein
LRPEADLVVSQRILAVVVNHKACDDGWALMFALNHKGDIVPFQARTKAYYVDMTLTGWLGSGEALREMSDDPDAMRMCMSKEMAGNIDTVCVDLHNLFLS